MNPNIVLRSLLGLFLFISPLSICYSQNVEICDNAIDDDMDGLIDLNDPDCDCPIAEPVSLIPNPSFEDTRCCPTNRSQMDCASSWIQASEATTDYLHTCGWMGWENLPPPLPFPDGDAVVGFRNGRFGNSSNPNWKEYVGACLLRPLKEGIEYKFQFYIGFTQRENSPELNLVFYGTPDCDNLPFGIGNREFGCPTNGPGWKELGQVRVGGNMQWRQVEITLTPDEDISAIAIGPDCVELNSESSTYYFFDNLILDELSAFELDIRPTTDLCAKDMTLKLPAYDTLNYQWYKEGIALLGENQPQLGKMYGSGVYQVRIISTNGECRITNPYIYDKPQSIEIQDTTICAGQALRFNGQGLTESGIYWDTLKTAANCDSIIQLNVSVFEDEPDTLKAKIFPQEFYQVGRYKYYGRGMHTSVLTSQSGCDSTVYLDLDFYRVYIPSAFTPNGDGFNDFFTIMGTEVRRISKLRVFDRWGNVMFEGFDLPPNNVSMGWDGNSKGRSVPQGVYMYAAYVILEDDKERILTGSVTLMR